jgi:hypothetical protein
MVGMTRKVGRTMNKRELKAKFAKAKKWCKEHQTELVMVLTGGIAAGIATGKGYKKGWNDAFDKWENHVDEHCAFLQPTEPITPRDLMRDDAIKKTIERGEASDRLDTPIKEIQFWFD